MKKILLITLAIPFLLLCGNYELRADSTKVCPCGYDYDSTCLPCESPTNPCRCGYDIDGACLQCPKSCPCGFDIDDECLPCPEQCECGRDINGNCMPCD
ncbi:MAG: hypothetical protein ABIE74_02695 [Pseudomonadota bacterium]